MAGASVEEQVIDDVAATLATITGGPTYNTNVVKVQRQGNEPYLVAERPACIVAHLGCGEWDGGQNAPVLVPNGLVHCELKLAVIGCINPDGDTWPETLSLFKSDIANALRADHERGGLALDTRIEGSEVFDGPDLGTGGVAAVQVYVAIHFRHLFTDDTQSF